MKNRYPKILLHLKEKPAQWLSLILHLSVWILLFIAFSLFSMRQDQSVPYFALMLYCYGFLLFYLNYFLLSPKLLLPKKYLAFFSSIFAIILLSFLVVDPLLHWLSFDDFMRNGPPAFSVRVPAPTFPQDMPTPPQERFFEFRKSFGMAFLVFAFLTSSSSIRIFQKMTREENLIKKYENEKLVAELKLLRQQINPHFLFNALNNIHSLAHRKSDHTSEAIMRLSAILRHMLSDNALKEIPIIQELEMVQHYIDLQKLWLKNSITVQFLINNISKDHFIEPFILNPLVENAFKYGVLHGTESVIKIGLSMHEDWLTVELENPIMRTKLNPAESMGIGLNNVARRLELCYPGNYILKNEQRGNNYYINLSIKLRKR